MTEEISMKNTKKEMLDLIENMRKEVSNKTKENLNPEKIKQEVKKIAVVDASDKTIDTELSTLIHQLKVSINSELTKLSDKLEAEAEKYENLKQAIEIKQAELHNLYGVDKAAAELVVILEAQKSSRETFESEMQEKRVRLEQELTVKTEKLQNEIVESKEEWGKEKAARQLAEKETKNMLDMARKRENEEYEYQLSRGRQLEENKHVDKSSDLEKALLLRRETIEKECQEKTNELNERELAVSERELTMKVLQEKVEAFPSELDKAIKSAVQEVKERLSVDFTQKEKLLVKGFEGEINVLKTKLMAFDTLAKEQTKQIDKLNSQQENAYEKIQDIANKAVSGAAERLQNVAVRTVSDKQS